MQDMKVTELLAANIQRRMDALNWKAKDLADAAGVSLQGIYSLLNGKNWIGADMLQAVARALDVPMSMLLTEDPKIRARQMTVTGAITPERAVVALAEFIFKAKRTATDGQSSLLVEFFSKLPVDLDEDEIRTLLKALDAVLTERARLQSAGHARKPKR